jgi:hypothetical protein
MILKTNPLYLAEYPGFIFLRSTNNSKQILGEIGNGGDWIDRIVVGNG